MGKIDEFQDYMTKAHQPNPPFPGAVFDETKHRWVQQNKETVASNPDSQRHGYMAYRLAGQWDKIFAWSDANGRKPRKGLKGADENEDYHANWNREEAKFDAMLKQYGLEKYKKDIIDLINDPKGLKDFLANPEGYYDE